MSTSLSTLKLLPASGPSCTSARQQSRREVGGETAHSDIERVKAELLVSDGAVHQGAGAFRARGISQLCLAGLAVLVLAPDVLHPAVAGAPRSGHGAVAVVGRGGHGGQSQLGLQQHRRHEQLRDEEETEVRAGGGAKRLPSSGSRRL